MIYHVLPGDAVAEEFKKAKIEGELIVCREVFVTGPIDADNLDEFWDERAKFILAEYGEDEIVYHETVADELAKLLDLDEDDEVNLWFEYELFCSVNMWFCLGLLSETGAAVYRVEPTVISAKDRWNGFGKLGAADLETCFDTRTYFTPKDVALGADLWKAYSKGDAAKLKELGSSESECFPYLAEVCEAALDQNTRPDEVISQITAEGKTAFEDIFAEFTKRAGVYGFGDLQVQRLLDRK